MVFLLRWWVQDELQGVVVVCDDDHVGTRDCPPELSAVSAEVVVFAFACVFVCVSPSCDRSGDVSAWHSEVFG